MGWWGWNGGGGMMGSRWCGQALASPTSLLTLSALEHCPFCSRTLSSPASSAQCRWMAPFPDVMAADTELFLTCELLCLCSSRVAAVPEDETRV